MYTYYDIIQFIISVCYDMHVHNQCSSANCIYCGREYCIHTLYRTCIENIYRGI